MKKLKEPKLFARIPSLFKLFSLFIIISIIFEFFLVNTVIACPLNCQCLAENVNSQSIKPSNSRIKFLNPRPQTSAKYRARRPKDHSSKYSIFCVNQNLKEALNRNSFNDFKATDVTTLDLSGNKLTELEAFAFEDFTALQTLSLSSNHMKMIHPKAFKGIHLKKLLLDRNGLPELIFTVLPASLEVLSLERNLFKAFPAAITRVSGLISLNLASNQINVIMEGDLRSLVNLKKLNLNQNVIGKIEARALAEVTKLEYLFLNNNRLKEIPSGILLCRDLVSLHLSYNHITHISENALQTLAKLQDLLLTGNPLKEIHIDAFRTLPSLRKLILKESWSSMNFPNLNGTSELHMIRIDRGSLTHVPENLCEQTPKLRSLILHRNQLSSLPSLEHCSDLRLLDLSYNRIQEIRSFAFKRHEKLQDLLLQHNLIRNIKKDTFHGLKGLQVLNLESNLIEEIHPTSFVNLMSLEDINLGNNMFPELPSKGFERVVSLKAHNNPYLKVFPSPSSFPSVHSLVLSYAYHCCAFLDIRRPPIRNGAGSGFIEDVVFDVDGFNELDSTIFNMSSIWPKITQSTKDFEALWSNLASSVPATLPHFSTVLNSESTTVSPYLGTTVDCIPSPGPFMPCQDLFDWWTLRCGIWIVFLLALLGNGTVVIVLIFARAKMDVPRFLVTNLAMADFFMGIYLGFLAVVDASTLGEFRMYAIPWQMSTGCQAAGFFGVLSSELSVYTLTVITLERNYAITHAMHLNKRLSLRHAAYIMIGGWLFSILMATLPLIGVSDYRKFAVCLPFETAGGGLAYVIFIMFINGIAFLILMGCYLKIYCSIRGSQAWNSNDSRIAKRMALLVFTDFLCWAPIAFFSLTAASGIQLISLEEAKIFTVFILPLNSCCNPFLYALLTKQFKKDCVILCKSIEESRVTRGIGRCKHSSNFSHRQTPVNTNSAVDHQSKGENQTCGCCSKQSDQNKIKHRINSTLTKYISRHKKPKENKRKEFVYEPTRLANNNKKEHLPSENYSSSCSDGIKKSELPSSLKYIDKRQANLWHLSRKSSQDSTLSSSRQDSSATTASTSTFRISRSSVSSDISSAGSRGYSTQNSFRINSLKDKRSDRLQYTKNSNQSQLEQSKLATGTWVSNMVRDRQKYYKPPELTDESPYSMGTDENILCPIHYRQENLSCVYEQESYEEDEIPNNQEIKESYLTPVYTPPNDMNTDEPHEISRNSSRAASVNDENTKESIQPLNLIQNKLLKETKTSLMERKKSSDISRCISLTTLAACPQIKSSLFSRFPSEGHLSLPNRRDKFNSSRSIDCMLLSSNSREGITKQNISPLCTETTALVMSDSEDDEVFFQTGKHQQYETHFPVNGEPEISFLINKKSSKHFRV